MPVAKSMTVYSADEAEDARQQGLTPKGTPRVTSGKIQTAAGCDSSAGGSGVASGFTASALAKPCKYTLSLWGRPTRFLEYPQLELSNNLAKNSMRPVALVLGRKNWIHIGSQQAGPKIPVILSVVEGCRRLKVRKFLCGIICISFFPAWPTSPFNVSRNSLRYMGYPEVLSAIARLYQLSHHSRKSVECRVADMFRISASLQLCCNCQNTLRRVVGTGKGMHVLEFQQFKTAMG